VLENVRYRSLVREHLVHQTLSKERSSAKLSVPPEIWEWAAGLSRSWVAELATAGYDVVGDLDDLIPLPALPYVDPESSSAEEQSAVLLRALTAMTVEAARLQGEVEARDQEIDRLAGELDRFYTARSYRFKQRVVARADRGGVLAVGLRVYRRLRP
jgi:hypothetical protein